jgi:3-phosphoshikimate 1-carboxyvinyltransferase
MAFAPLAIKLGSINIENPNVVKKSYPNFWEDIKSVGFDVKASKQLVITND